MKFLTLFNIVCAYGNNGEIGYLCNQCDLYDLQTNTIFEELELRGPRPIVPNPSIPKINTTSGIRINVTCNDMPAFTKSFMSINETTTLIFAATSVVVGIINLVTTVTLLGMERKINASARKTYMQTAILENE